MEFLTADTDYLNLYLIPWTINLVTALAVYVLGRWIAKLVTKAVGRLMEKSGVDETLSKFLCDIIYAALLVAVVIAALGQLGIDTTSVLAVFAAAGLAVGLAMKDSLSNFAAGVMLILFKPFKVGDFIEAGGSAGVVESVSVFCTIFRTGDNREIIVPNSAISSGTIINVTKRDTRRIDLVFGIGYGDDIRKAKQLMQAIVDADERILKDPAVAISVAELAESSVNLNLRPWVNAGDYWDVRSDLLEKVKESFDANGISIPYPQLDVHHPEAA